MHPRLPHAGILSPQAIMIRACFSRHSGVAHRGALERGEMAAKQKLPAQPSGYQCRSEQCEMAEVEIPVYSYAELKKITNGFSAENFMGKTFSSNSLLYRGEIVDKESNLVRKVIVEMRKNEKDYDLKVWQTQLNALKDPTISSHPNVVKLQGYCNSVCDLGLVYDCHALGTLHSLIFDESFSWSMRMKVALQLARVLQFLHSQEKPLILLNFEPRSILVDMDFNPLIFGFGLASGGVLGIIDHTVLRLIILNGPQVYLDPEYTLCGITIGPWCDVFSFGTLLLAMITKSHDQEVRKIITRSEYAFLQRFYGINFTKFIVLKNFWKDGNYHIHDSAAVTKLAVRCVKSCMIGVKKYHERPGVSEAVSILECLRVVKELGLHCSSLA
ncbi:probable serine/threonine-protein kinase PBL16 isoform X1 [Elaeis guineensis]|uniref:probable serine/threonine-protein kinase PBL16 isoform X1 n=1 Tax=Elaeis guineensis var. tenera TaxID=51953 RepID=UPI003C6DB677